jgi:O-antigen/teichoic acid export membrane protein
VLLTVSISLIISVFIKYILQILVSPAYLDVYKIIPLIMLSFCFFIMIRIFEFPIFYKKKTKLIPLIRTIIVLASFILFIVFIPLFGLIGAAISIVISMFIFSLFYYLISKHLIDIKYEFKRIFMIFIFAILIYLCRTEWTCFNIFGRTSL